MNQLLDQKQSTAGFQKKEGFVHAVLEAALQDDALLRRVNEGPEIYRSEGAQDLQNRGH
jgi:hypothetical protein